MSLTQYRQLRHRVTCKVNLFVLDFSIISSSHLEKDIMFYFVILCVGIKKNVMCVMYLCPKKNIIGISGSYDIYIALF